MLTQKLKTVKKGELIRFPNSNKTYVKGEYHRESKKYFVTNYNDISDSKLIDGNRQVSTDFIF